MTACHWKTTSPLLVSPSLNGSSRVIHTFWGRWREDLSCTCPVYLAFTTDQILYTFPLKETWPVLTWLWTDTGRCISCNISNTKGRVWPHFQTPRRELKIRRAAEYFWRTSRCLEMWSNTVLSFWYIFSIETKTREKTKKQNRKNLC